LANTRAVPSGLSGGYFLKIVCMNKKKGAVFKSPKASVEPF
jgi:hypothetical protein